MLITKIIKVRNSRSINPEFRELYKRGAQEVKIEHLSKNSTLKVLFKCDLCGIEYKVIYRSYLQKKNKGICVKCVNKDNKRDIENDRFGKLVVLEDDGTRTNDRHIKWKCKCDCGNTTYVSSNNLKSGKIQSCGCLAKELLIERHKNLGHKIWSELTEEEILNEKNDESNRWLFIKSIKTNQCYLSGTQTDEVEGHHLNSWGAYPTQRFNKNNIRFIKIDLHKQFHKEYGRSNNNVGQFYEYLTLLSRRQDE